jgi:hypothetical protein
MIGRYMDSAFRQKVLGRVGHRGLFLIALGLFDIFYGLYLVLGGQLQFPLQLSNQFWGWAWTGVGAALVIGAFMRRDAPFFALAVFIKTAWALEFVRLTFISDKLQWPRAASWGCFAILVLIASAWPEPRMVPRSEEAVTRAESVRDEEQV